MSTKMSSDMVIERSSTRLHAPPGGKSSICFGSYEPEVVKPTNRGVAKESANTGMISQQYAENVEPQRNAKKPYANNQQSGSSMKDIMGGADTAATFTRVRQAPGGNSTFTLG